MKSAIYKNNLIHLKTINRGEFQKLYEDSKKGLLTCSECGKPVRLYLGIHSTPHFLHHLNKKSSCKDVEPSSLQPQENDRYFEQNGFQLPISRAIATAEPEDSYKVARSIKIEPSFIDKISGGQYSQNEYIQNLQRSGIQFDVNQEQAVTHLDGPLLILAGAGSGKTRVLTARTAFLIVEEKVMPNEIMLVTFTAKAAAEMKTRLMSYSGLDARQINTIVSGTFHSIFYKILLFHQREKWSGEHLLKKDWQREQIIKEAGRKLDLDEKEFAYDLALQQIGFWKNTMQLPNTAKPENEWEEKVSLLYHHYEKTKEQSGMFDFDDMLLGCHRLFMDHPEILKQYQTRFSHFLIDEFQDINKVQYELIKMMSGQTRNVCAVGDDDQSIYAFRGSDPAYLLDFEKDFPGCKRVVLNQNYRSAHEIVETANTIISVNMQRYKKEMRAQYTTDIQPTLFYPYDEEEEATMIITDIQEKIQSGAEPRDFVILFRTNTASRAIFERLASSSLPFKMDQGVDSFYERYMVRAMLAFFRLSLNGNDSEAIKNILPALFLKQAVFRDLQAESILKDCSMLDALSYVKTGFAFQEQKLKKLAANIRSLLTLTPLQAIERVEKDLGFLDFVKKRGSEGNQWDKGSDDIRDLRVVAKNFKNISELIDHADHMTAMNREIKQHGKHQDNAIILSTIHRAKGLEYQYVYLLGVVDGSIPHDFALDSYRNGDSLPLEEERRLLYVAITRAKEQLYLSVPEYRRVRKANPSRFLTILKSATKRS